MGVGAIARARERLVAGNCRPRRHTAKLILCITEKLYKNKL